MFTTPSCRYTGFAELPLNGEGMSSLKEFQCEICGIVSDNPIHWFVIECGDQRLAVIKWDLTAAGSPRPGISVEKRTLRSISAAGSNPFACLQNPYSKPPRPLGSRRWVAIRSA